MISERLVSLLELLRFYAESYTQLSKSLFDLQLCLQMEQEESNQEDEYALSEETKKEMRVFLLMAKHFCDVIGLTVSSRHADELLLQVGAIRDEGIRAFNDNIQRELSCRLYVGISEDRKEAYCESRKGWESVLTRFPAATEDVEEMNKCYALCRYSAAVFHSLQVMEHGLVALGKCLGVTDPKEGWDASCKKLDMIVKAGRNANSTGLKFEFMEQVNACIQVIKMAWRNKVSHATGKPIVMQGGFAPYVAEEIIAATRGFMRILSHELPEQS